MIDNTIKKDIIEYCNFDEIKQYKLWVYDGSDIIEVFYEQMPNTQQITFSFYSFSKYYWNLMANWREAGVKFTIGSDQHSAHYVPFMFSAAELLLDSYGFKDSDIRYFFEGKN